MKENNTYHEGMDGLNLPESWRVNPFIVPDNYFDTFSSNLFSTIRFREHVDSKDAGFSVPEQYFLDLSANITSHTKLETLAKKTEAWTIPSRYFDELPKQIQSNIRIESLLDKSSALSVPEDYFDILTDRIQDKIFEDSLKKVVLTDGFNVPTANYFDHLSTSITKTISDRSDKQDNSAKPTMIRSLNIQQWIRYAAAAFVATVLGISSYNAVVDQEQIDRSTVSHLATIPEQEIINYLASSNDSDDIVYIMEYIYQPEESEGVGSQIDDEDIEDYLKYML